MGTICSNYSQEVPTMQRLQYDLSQILSLNPIFIWFVGLPGSGRKTHVNSLCERMALTEIPVVALLVKESKKDTDRGKILRDVLKGRMKRAPDELVVDLIKEALLQSTFSRNNGYIINNFPRSKKQAKLFVKEIKDVEAIIYLFADMSTLATRLVSDCKSDEPPDVDIIKKQISDSAKEIKEAISGMKVKVEKIFTEATVNSVKLQIESAIQERTNLKPMQSLTEVEQRTLSYM
ncbi:hypothetical protein WA026_006462 [Henosepilachna vigintioctopunctata]|uniref:Adenylate kinase n=1 Tax=Henosepilachna vigintioctopunctata TaxID=420089 RepID=A0AAW1UFR9_9CUCU